jgi:hypothetical protein
LQSRGAFTCTSAPGTSDPEALGFSRHHTRNIGAAIFLCRFGKTAVLVHSAPAFSLPLQQRWLANAIPHLAGM